MRLPLVKLALYLITIMAYVGLSTQLQPRIHVVIGMVLALVLIVTNFLQGRIVDR